MAGSFNPFLNSITAFNPFLNSILPSKPPKLKTSTLPTLQPSPASNPPALGPSPASNLPALRPSPASNLPALRPSPTSNLCLGFCLTNCKVQGETLPIAILDIKHNSTSKGKNPHKRFCSTYVQLSRLPSLEGLHLLQRIEMKDLQFGPDHQLLAEMQRLEELQRDTIAAWVG